VYGPLKIERALSRERQRVRMIHRWTDDRGLRNSSVVEESPNTTGHGGG
jgi:hypothetical protein